MGKQVLLLTTIVVFFVVVDVASAGFFWNAQKLSAPSPKEHSNPNTTVSPFPGPAFGEKPLKRAGEEKAKDKQNQQPSQMSTPADEKSKDKQVLPPPSETKEENKTPKEEVKEEGKSKSDVPAGSNDKCDGAERRCQDNKSLFACIQSIDGESKALVLIQNKGDSNLKVDLRVSPPKSKQNVDVPKHKSKKVDVLLGNGGNTITLDAGYGDCILHLGAPVSQGNYFQWLPSYSKFMTPMYGAYFLFLTTLIAGGVWGCCWFTKRKRHGDVPYQELEMSMPESAAATETAEGWDQGWDDDWDEEKAVRSPGGRGISANGLTSRTAKKDDWEDRDD